jgi:hypothetical protein
MTAAVVSSFRAGLVLSVILILATSAHAAFIVQVDTDGSSSNAAFTPNARLSFGNGMTTSTGGAGASTHATAVGLAVGNSIFGGNSSSADQYIFTYKLGLDADNYSPAPGTVLGNGNSATGVVGGATGQYNVYACWSSTTNVSDNGATPTSYVAASDTGNVTTGLNQDEDTNGALAGGVWALVGTVHLTAGNNYTVTQTAPNSLFVSMRAEAIMWEAVPEPSSIGLGLVSGMLLLARRRRASAA